MCAEYLAREILMNLIVNNVLPKQILYRCKNADGYIGVNIVENTITFATLVCVSDF